MQYDSLQIVGIEIESCTELFIDEVRTLTITHIYV